MVKYKTAFFLASLCIMGRPLQTSESPVFSGIANLHQSLWLIFLQLFKSPVVVSRSHSASLKSCIRQVTDGKVSRGKTLHVNISFRATSWQINGFDGLQTPSLASYLTCCLWIPDRSPDCPCVYQTQTQPMGRSRLSIQYCLLRK